ncbi:MAG: helix-turn-helix domain-containing protein [Candidatus Omnitrophota bacterium]
MNNTEWLWDIKLDESEARAILKDPDNKRFVTTAARLFARTGDPKKAFDLIDKTDFVQNWTRIKKRLRSDKWSAQRLEFWQSVYEVIAEDLKKSGLSLRQADTKIAGELCAQIGDKLRTRRKQLGLTQRQLAEKLGVSQQVVSHVENGKDNISVLTLKRFADALNSRVSIAIN